MRFPFVVLDLAGTLVDTTEDLTAALNLVLEQQGQPPLASPQVAKWAGDNLRAILRAAFAASGRILTDLETGELLNDFRKTHAETLGQHARLHPGVPEALSALAAGGVRMSLLTNKPLATTLRLAARMGLAEFFDYVVAGDGEGPRKPDPAGLTQLMAQGQARKAATLVVGSTRLDLETARNAGVRCALIEQSGGPAVRGMGADYVLAQPQMLVALCVYRPLSDAWLV